MKQSHARDFFDNKCNHSMADSITQLETIANLGLIYKHEQTIYGRIIYLFNDGSSMQLCGWGYELKVVEAI